MYQSILAELQGGPCVHCSYIGQSTSSTSMLATTAFENLRLRSSAWLCFMNDNTRLTYIVQGNVLWPRLSGDVELETDGGADFRCLVQEADSWFLQSERFPVR